MRIKMTGGTYGYRNHEGIIEIKNERSAAFEVSEKEGRRLIDTGYAVPADCQSSRGVPVSEDMPESGEETDVYTVEQLMDMSKRDLEKLAKDMGIASYGTKEELAERIATGTGKNTEDAEDVPGLMPAEPEE